MRKICLYILLILIFVSAFLIVTFLNKNSEELTIILPQKNIKIKKTKFSSRGKIKIETVIFEKKDNMLLYTWAPTIKKANKLKFNLIVLLKNPKKLKSTSNKYTTLLVKKNDKIIFKTNLTKIIKKRKKFFFKNFSINIKIKKGDILKWEIKANRLVGKLLDFYISGIKLENLKQNKLPNIIIISIDTLRADYLGIYNKITGKYKGDFISPNIDQMFNDSVLFLNAYTTYPATWPALASLFTSLFPSEHGVVKNGYLLPKNILNFTSILKKSGYYNIALRANANGLNIKDIHFNIGYFSKDKVLAKKAVQIIKGARNDRLFMWVHFLGVHAPYIPHSNTLKILEEEMYKGPATGNSNYLCGVTKKELNFGIKDLIHIKNLYKGELIEVDKLVGEIFNSLKKQDLWENSLIILTSDHGEELYEHNRFFFHYPSVYNSVLHIPLIVKFPNNKFKGKIVRANVSILDIMPTILDIINSPLEEKKVKGMSLLKVINNENKYKRRVVFQESGESKIYAITSNKYRLIFNPNLFNPTTMCKTLYFEKVNKFECYNTEIDPNEKINIFNKDSECLSLKKKFYLTTSKN